MTLLNEPEIRDSTLSIAHYYGCLGLPNIIPQTLTETPPTTVFQGRETANGTPSTTLGRRALTLDHFIKSSSHEARPLARV